MNVKITERRIGFPYQDGRGPWVPRSNRIDVFKYCLASYAVLEPHISTFHLNVVLDGELINHRDELEQYICDLFPSEKLDLRWSRCELTNEWRKFCDEIFTDDNELVWWAGNDDHIFIDYNLDMVKASIHQLNNDPDPNAIVYYSHQPEQMRMTFYKGGTLTDDGNFIKCRWNNLDSIQIMKVGRFRKMWFTQDYGQQPIVYRTDDLFNWFRYNQEEGNHYAPLREMVRHYDGYKHVGNAMANWAAPLYIPPGFFEKKMTITIGDFVRDNYATNFNPINPNLYNVDEINGTDYRWVHTDIPLFWEGHVEAIEWQEDCDRNEMYSARNQAFLKMSRLPMQCFGLSFNADSDAPPLHWFSKHLLS